MDSQEYKIIKLSPERWQEYRAIRLESLKNDPQAYLATYEDNLKKTDQEWIERLSYKHPADMKLGLECAGKLVGLIGSFWTDEDPKAAFIYQVYIDKAHRGKGLAKILLTEILDYLSKVSEISAIKLSVVASQLPAHRSYLKAGFREVGRKKDEVLFEGKYWDEIEMEKPAR